MSEIEDLNTLIGKLHDRISEMESVMELMALDIRKRNPELKNFPASLIYHIYLIKAREE